MRKLEHKGKKKSQKEKNADFYKFSHYSTICSLTSRRKTCFMWQPGPLEIPWTVSLLAGATWQLSEKAKGEQATASTDAAEWSGVKILLSHSPGLRRWQMMWFILDVVSATVIHKKAKLNQHFCSMPILWWTHPSSQYMLPSHYECATQLHPKLSFNPCLSLPTRYLCLSPVFNLFNSCKATPSS